MKFPRDTIALASAQGCTPGAANLRVAGDFFSFKKGVDLCPEYVLQVQIMKTTSLVRTYNTFFQFVLSTHLRVVFICALKGALRVRAIRYIPYGIYI